MLYDAQKANVLKDASAILSDITLATDSAARFVSFLFAVCRQSVVRSKSYFGIENTTMQKNVILRIIDDSVIKSVSKISGNSAKGRSGLTCSFQVA